jgi:hypothetical protein
VLARHISSKDDGSDLACTLTHCIDSLSLHFSFICASVFASVLLAVKSALNSAAMIIIDCSTLTLHSVERSRAPPYAALSHTWTDDEVSFEDMKDLYARESRKGWNKIKETCQRANSAGLRFAWIDTCCIDKNSSAELQENINSMFNIYAQAKVCFVYLADFKLPIEHRAHFSQSWPDITGCRWFERGWTLQELIAPSTLHFFDQDWTFIGNRNDLSGQISRRTNIPWEVLMNRPWPLSIQSLLTSYPIAMRMSWASGRTTTRPEDMAHSLLGIFNINMPLLYGEGDRAFSRLQEELIKKSNDASIFAWQTSSRDCPMPDSSVPSYVSRTGPRGVLAWHPRDFVHGHKIMASRYGEAITELALTNKGLRIEATLKQICPGLFFMPLHHTWGLPTGGTSTASESVGICLASCQDGTYARAFPEMLLVTSHEHFDAENRPTRAQTIRGQLYIAK